MGITHKLRKRKSTIFAYFVLFFLLVGFGCGPLSRGGNNDMTEHPVPLIQDETQSEKVETQTQSDTSIKGLSIELSDGSAQPQIAETIPRVKGTPLTNTEIEAIISRLPELEPDLSDQTDFNFPEESLPPPRTGETINEQFPKLADDSPIPIDSGPLEVIRYSPEGEIPIAPFVNITFNQPMVPLATIEQLNQENIPVIIQPSIPGSWRWLGTKTLNFQFDSALVDRMPMATEYTVTVPSGTKSVIGGVLEETVQFSFNTPPPTILKYYPSNDPQPLEPIFFISFDQRIDPEAVLETVRVTADGKSVDVLLATDDEIKSDSQVSKLVERSVENRWLAFRTKDKLPADSSITVLIGPGTPSAEGPKVTENSQSYSFHTYAPLRIDEHGCSWGWDECRPLVPFYIRFNNPIDPDEYKDSMLEIDPAIPGAYVNVLGNTLQIRGSSVGQTTYKIKVSGKFKDIFDQEMGEDVTLEFKVGTSEPALTGPDEILVTLDPASKKPVLSLYAINYTKLDLKIYKVQPSDWPEFKEYLREYQRTDRELQPPGKLVLNETKRLETPTDTLTEIGIDLSEVMDGEFGHFIIIAKPPKGLFQEERYWETVHVWVQVTQIGIDAFADHSDMVVWTNSLSDGSPLENIEVKSNSGIILGVTGRDGISKFSIPQYGISYLIATNGDDTAFLPPSTYYWGDDIWNRRPVNDRLIWYVFDDRQMYKPGEDVHVKGWIRLIGGKQDGDVGLVGSSLANIRYEVIGPQGNSIGGDIVDINLLGGFDFTFSLPENMNLGYARIELNAIGNLGSTEGLWQSHNFQIQEFRRPEFEVTARNETTGPYFVGDKATVAVEAKYYAGGPLPNAEVTWYVNSFPTNYSPPNWPDFSFGYWQPWWWWYYGEDSGEGQTATFSGKTDPTGNHYLNLDFHEAEGNRPFSVGAEATVIDVNRQAWTGSTNLIVHPASLYVGLRSDHYFVEKGTPLDIDFIVTDLDGNPNADRLVIVSAARLEWRIKNGTWNEEEVNFQECKEGSKIEPVTCTFETPIGGRYRIAATVTDEFGRTNRTQIIRWVSGGQQPPSREVEKEVVNLIPDKENYIPGDLAKILVQSPFNPAEGLLTVSRSGILYTERFKISDGSVTIEIPIKDAHIPNLNVQVDLVGASPRTDDQGEVLPEAPNRPAYASGTITLNIPPLQRTLSLDLLPEETQLEPGGETTLEVTLQDRNEKPVANAELAVVVVDEAILALTNYQLTDPVSVFYATRPSELSSFYSRASIILTDPQALLDAVETAKQLSVVSTEMVEGEAIMEMAMEAPAAEPAARDMAGGEASSPAPIRVRSDFNPLATFAPEVRTNADGKAQINIQLPDNLTRYRIMVVAVDSNGNSFGSGETNLTARLPLMVRPSAPRFLNFGDEFELPVVLQNQTNEKMTVDVVIQASNLSFTADSGLRVEVPANDRVEVRFPSKTEMAGIVRFQIAATSGDSSDAATGELPVYTPATTEAFATYGVVDSSSILQPISTPQNVFSQFGGLEIQTSSTALQALTDAVIYLYSYPYECSEQLSSRILGIAALRDVLAAFEAEGLPSAEAMEAAVQRDIEILQGIQNWDGGFPYWRRGQDSIPFNTIHVAHALQRAKLKGFTIPVNMQEQLLPYLQDIENHYPYWYSLRTRQTLSAYALYVRDLMGDPDPDKARHLLNDAGVDTLSLEAVGWIWGVLVDDPESKEELSTIRRHVNNQVVETPSGANFTTHYHDQTYLLLSSNRRTDAILLDSFIADNPESDLIPKIVNGLLAHKVKGRWNNTQENVFVLLALDRYFKVYESQTPDFVARIWLGNTYAGEHTYAGRTTERHETKIPMVYLTDFEEEEKQELIISKEGNGRLYYRLGLRYAPTSLWLDPLDMGFVVQRVYEPVDDPGDVTRDKDGIWHIKAGSRVRIRLTMVADNRRYHVALVDPLPAGLEIVNPALAVSGTIPQDPESENNRYGWWWYWTWYEHQNMRDEKAEVFTPLLWDGVYEYTYIARATIPGTYITPPAKAEEMYSPEVFGRSSSDWVIIEQ